MSTSLSSRALKSSSLAFSGFIEDRKAFRLTFGFSGALTMLDESCLNSLARCRWYWPDRVIGQSQRDGLLVNEGLELLTGLLF